MARLLRVLVLGSMILLVAASSGCSSEAATKRTIVLYGFSAMENVMKEAIIPAFQQAWRGEKGQEMQVVTSFAGSGTITNQIIFGAPAQVAIVSTEMDVLTMERKGMVTSDWRGFKHRGSFAYSITCLVTRQGNPKGLHSFEDAGKDGLNVVYPDPTTSGGAQWAILALYGSALKESEAATGSADEARATDLLKRVTRNAGSLPESARRALTQFGLGYGDALLTYENEALFDIAKGKPYEVIVPRSTIAIEPKVVMVDRNIEEADKELMQAFVDFLWSREAQEALVENHFRVWDEALMDRYADRYQVVDLPFTVDYLGGWQQASGIIDETWRAVQREVN